MLNLLTSKNPTSHDEDILRQAHVPRREYSNQSINPTMQHASSILHQSLRTAVQLSKK